MGVSEASREASGGPELLRLLAWLDARLERAVRAQQAAAPNAAADPYRGLYVAHEEAAVLAGRLPGAPAAFASAETDALPAPVPHGRLGRLAGAAGLSALDLQILLVALAPELDLKYERVYAYLQDDVTRKRPTVDLALHLLAPSWEARVAGRERLSAAAPLRRRRIVRLVDDPALREPPLLSRYLKPEERVVDFLLGSGAPDARLLPYALLHAPAADPDGGALILPPELEGRLDALAAAATEHGAVFHFQGPYGAGKRSGARALCARAGLGLLAIDAGRLAAADAGTFDEVAEVAGREARLQGAALFWDDFDALASDDRRSLRGALLRQAEPGTLTFLAGEGAWHPGGELPAGLPFFRVPFGRPDHARRMRLWERALDGAADEVDAEALAARFRFTGGQIRDAAATARSLARLRDPAGGRAGAEDVARACRIHAAPRLSSLARKVEPRYGWDDLVLPAERKEQLREIANSLRYRSRVYHAWGFDRKLAMGKGLNVLFSGPPGTGKTMAAEVIAAELGLELFRIDLSSVVSKYIGETEKHLARLFTEAETSGAILFFDEADALFGRRSEVRDSHDRYANLEVSYLLQRMEEYEGVVVLATNFRKNMDEAFVRRMHFTVDFPFPSVPERLRIWEQVWPPELPRDPALPLDALARRLELAGGSIRNVALAAAFLAADGAGVVRLEHLVRAARREYQKMGKVVSDAELGGWDAEGAP